ncbi:MAG TPA: GntR family transcriptional regulator, partial [bacterium]|nr:GntR family transcriptional regulator [bacterium]
MRKVTKGAIYYATQIKEDIRQKILSGKFQKGDKLPSEEEIANSYGVSRMTARQALVELVVEGFIYRIPGKGTYVADIHSIESKEGSIRGLVALIVPNLHLTFYYQIISGVEKVLKNDGIDMVLKCVNEDPVEERVIFEKFIKSPVGGLLVISGWYTKENSQLLRDLMDKMPVVIIDVKIDGIKVDTVISDDRKGGFLATEHLVELGHKNILHLAGPEGDSSADNRRAGYREALEKYNIEYREEYIRFTNWEMKEGYYQTKKFFMNNGSDVTGIFTCNDEVAA